MNELMGEMVIVCGVVVVVVVWIWLLFVFLVLDEDILCKSLDLCEERSFLLLV